MALNRNSVVILFLLGLLILLSSLPVAVITNAAKYAQVSREIISNHDWINLTIAGDAYDQKPPLLFWIVAVFYSIFGISLFTYKIPVILVSFLGIFSTWKLGKLLYGKETGLLAAALWVTSLSYLHFHNDIHTDTLLTTFVVFAVWQFAAFFRKGKWHQFALGIVGVGLSMLTKGPVGMAIPAFAVGADLLFQKRFKDIFHWRWIPGILLVGIIISPALIGLVNQFGIEGIKFYFWTNNVGRITGSYAGTNTDPTFYIHNSLYLLLPWTIFAFTAIALEIGELVKSRGKHSLKGEVINLSAILLYLVVLSIAKAKNPHYMLAVVPFIFILTAKWTIKIFNKNKSKLKRTLSGINKGVAILMLAIPLVFSLYIFPENNIFYWIIYLLLFTAAVYLLVVKSNLNKQLLLLAFSFGALIFTLNSNMLPNMLQYQSSIKASEDFNGMAGKNATLNIYGTKARHWELFLYSKNPGKYITTKNELQKCISAEPDAWFYTDPADFEDMKQLNLDVELVKTYQHKTVTRQSLKFLNPKTRAEHFETKYLVRVKQN